MQLYVPRVLLHKEHLAHDRQAPYVNQKHLQPFEPSRIIVGGTVHGGEDKEHHPSRNSAKTQNEQSVRRADDLDVQAVRVMPPVIKRSRGEHRDTPQPARKIPSGARSPKTFTEAAESSGSRKTVAFTISEQQMMPASTPHAYIAM